MSNCGIGSIINNVSNKRFIFKSTDLDLRFANYVIQLDMGCHYNHELQRDWKELGSENFSFETRELTLNDEAELNARLVHHINICEDSYNILNSKQLFGSELDSKVEILSRKLYGLTGKKGFNENFKSQLDNFNLSQSDGEKFIEMMLDKINSDEINYYNFDLKYDSLLKEMSINKKISLKKQKKENLLEYLYSKIGRDSNSTQFKEMLDNHRLGLDVGSSIRLEMERLIDEEKINSNYEIDEKLDELLKREQDDRIAYEKNQEMSLKKLYSITGDYVPKATFLYKLNSLGLSIEEGNVIKKEIERKIKFDEISFDKIEFEVNNELEKKSRYNKENIHKKKSELLNALYDITGNQEISGEFSNQLSNHDLHQNIGFQIQSNIANRIETGYINRPDEISSEINKLILKKEKEDVELRLNELSKQDIDFILKRNSIGSAIPLKTAKVKKLVNIVPLNILKENIKSLGHDLDVNFVDNPNVIFCSQCGFKNTADSLFCSECGNKLE